MLENIYDELITHLIKVSYYANLVSKEINLSETERGILKYASFFHDIGKLCVPLEIINKPVKLNKQESVIMKQHPIYSEQILMLKGMKEVALIVRSHHERVDGKGYPDALIGNNIPLLAKVLSVADSFDAMTTQRTYNKPKSKKEAILELKINSGTQFDSLVVDGFIEAIKMKGNL